MKNRNMRFLYAMAMAATIKSDSGKKIITYLERTNQALEKILK